MKTHAFVTTLVLLLLATATTAIAGFDIDFGANVQLGDDRELYFAISSRYFDRDRQEVEHWGARYSDPDQLAVALFIGKHSGHSLDAVFDLRRRGLSWWEISVRLGTPTDVWFVPVKRDPGPPYGKAYGYWKKHGSDARSLKLTDADASNLVAVRILHEYYGVPVEVAMEWRRSGSDLRALMSDEYEKRHGHGATQRATKGHKGKPGAKGRPH